MQKYIFVSLVKAGEKNVGFSWFSVILNVSLAFYVNFFMKDPKGR